MAGLLDSPLLALGTGLLSTAGPSTDPSRVGFGPGLQMGLQNLSGIEKLRMERERARIAQQNSQIQGLLAKTNLEKAQLELEQDRRDQDRLNRVLATLTNEQRNQFERMMVVTGGDPKKEGFKILAKMGIFGDMPDEGLDLGGTAKAKAGNILRKLALIEQTRPLTQQEQFDKQIASQIWETPELQYSEEAGGFVPKPATAFPTLGGVPAGASQRTTPPGVETAVIDPGSGMQGVPTPLRYVTEPPAAPGRLTEELASMAQAYGPQQSGAPSVYPTQTAAEQPAMRGLSGIVDVDALVNFDAPSSKWEPSAEEIAKLDDAGKAVYRNVSARVADWASGEGKEEYKRVLRDQANQVLSELRGGTVLNKEQKLRAGFAYDDVVEVYHKKGEAKKFHIIKKGKALTSEERMRNVKFEVMKAQLKTISELKEKVDVGRIGPAARAWIAGGEGLWKVGLREVAGLFGIDKLTDDEARLLSALRNYSNTALDYLRGAQVGPAEQIRFELSLPGLMQERSLFDANLNSQLDSVYAAYTEVTRQQGDEPVSRSRFNKMLNVGSSSKSGATSSGDNRSYLEQLRRNAGVIQNVP